MFNERWCCQISRNFSRLNIAGFLAVFAEVCIDVAFTIEKSENAVRVVQKFRLGAEILCR